MKHPNKIIKYDNYAELVLETYNHQERARALISLDSISKVISYRWYLDNSGYVRSKYDRNKYVFLHRIILNLPDNKFTDHINNNKLDNRNENLRICTKAENNRNAGIQVNSATGYTGVNLDKRRNKYRAYIKFNKKQIFLGYFNTIEDAAKVREQAEREYFKDFSYKRH